MKLTAKLASALFAVVVLVLAFAAFIQVRRERSLFDDDMRRDNRALGEALAAAMARVWRVEGEAGAMRLLGDVDRVTHSARVSWVWLDAAASLDPDDRAALARGEPRTRRLSSTMETYVPLPAPDGRSGAIDVSEALDQERVYVSRTLRNQALSAVLLLGACSVVMLALSVVLVGRRVARLVATTRRVSAGDLSPDAAPRGRDELAQLARELNDMCVRLAAARDRVAAETAARIAAVDQLRHADRLASVGKLASGLAHELGTPLNIVEGRALMIAGGEVQGDDARRNAGIIAKQSERMATIIRELLDFARRGVPDKVKADLVALARQTVSLLGSMADKVGAKLVFEPPPEPLPLVVNAAQIQQVLTNLIVNSIHAAPRGSIVVAVGRRAAAPPGGAAGEYACATVRDTGRGMTPDELEHLFEPFFTTKPVGEGTGLGLAVAYGIVRDHDGWIEVNSRPGAGSELRVFLPLGAATAPPRP